MARQQHFDWFLSHQRRRKTFQRKSPQDRPCAVMRRPTFELLEARNLLSINVGQPAEGFVEGLDVTSASAVVATVVAAPVSEGLWFIPEGEAPPQDWSDYGQEDVSSNFGDGPVGFTALASWPDQDLNTEGIQITYSYSNFFDGGLGDITEQELRAATEEALTLWSTYAPLHFIEVVDSGPLPDDGD